MYYKKLYPRLLILCILVSISGAARSQNEPYTLFGPSEIDLSVCSVAGPEGSVSIQFWVMRQPSIPGPAQVTINNLPPGVSVNIAPSNLDFNGGVIVQLVTATFTMAAGVPFPDQEIWVEIGDGTNRNAYAMILHGTCPRHNKDFIIKGSFLSNHLGVIVPVSGALVDIYRDVSWRVDQHVGTVKTDDNGAFEAHQWADDEDTYYAKLRLNDGEGVYLRDWWTPEIKDFNSVNRGSNRDPIIDVGATVISRDDGSSTPKTSIWQGGRATFQEFIQVTGTPPPTGDYEIVIQNTATGIVWTARSTTNWEDKAQTYGYSGGKPEAPGDLNFNEYYSQFTNYRTNFHEFGHALRHTVDGSQAHFLNDAARWTYARGHSICGSNAGYIETEAYGFNEGWAEYWSGETQKEILRVCPSINITDLTIEGSVAYDLNYMAGALRDCLPVSPLHGKAATMKERQAMFSVLNRGDNIIHSQGEFRSNYQQQFPQCGILPPGVAPLVVPAVNPILYTTRPNRARFMEAMSHLISSQQTISAVLRRQLSEYNSKSKGDKEQSAKKELLADSVIVRLIASTILKGKLNISELMIRSFRKRLSIGADTLPEKFYSEKNMQLMDRQKSEFSKAVRSVTMKTMQECVKVIRKTRGNNKDATQEVSNTNNLLHYFERKVAILKIKSPINDDLYSILELPSNKWDDSSFDAKQYKDIIHN